MSNPLPIISLDTRAEVERLFRAMYAIGWGFGSGSAPYGREIERAWTDYQRSYIANDEDKPGHIDLKTYWIDKANLWTGRSGIQTYNVERHIRANSVSHFVSCARQLKVSS